MNYEVPTAKFFIKQFTQFVPYNSNELRNGYSFHNIQFQRIWLQGVIVKIVDDTTFLLDDGTGIARIDSSPLLKSKIDFPKQIGMYVLVIGTRFNKKVNGVLFNGLKAYKLADFSEDSNREVLWIIDVMTTQREYYLN